MTSIPSTPVSRRTSYRPLNSSPLVSPSPCRHRESLSERRRSLFKSQTPTSSLFRNPSLPSSLSASRTRITTPSTTRTHSSPHVETSRRMRSVPDVITTIPPSDGTYSPFRLTEDPQKQFLRERLKAKCLDRVEKARARAVKKRRYTGYSDRSSDGFDVDEEDRMDEEDEEDDDAIMGDELFRRIMAQTNRKMDHQFQLSYAQEVGSSFDPDIEDVNEWENLMQGNPHVPQQDVLPEEDFDDLDGEELEAYAAECARQAALDEWADIPEEELFQLPSDLDDILQEDFKVGDDMDVS